MFCFICGKEAECPHAGEHAQVQKACEQKKAALWVHVVDDAWNNVKDVPITADGEVPTGENGFSKFDPIDAGKQVVKLALTDDLPKKYDPPADLEPETTLSNGQVNYVVFHLVRRAKLKVHVHLKDAEEQGRKGADVTITPRTKGNPDTKKTVGDGALADFEDRSADDYDVSAVLSDEDKLHFYCPEAPLPLKLKPGEDRTFPYPVSPLARPKIVVVEKKSRAAVKEVAVKLKKGGEEHDFGKTAVNTGLAELAVDKPGLRGAEYDVLLTVDEKVYLKPAAAPKVTFADGSTETKTIELVKLARPKIRVVEDATGKEVEGVVVSLTANKDHKKNDLDATRNSGFTDIAADKAGLPPDTYAVAVAADSYKPVLVTPANVTFDEGDEKTEVIRVTTPKGAIRFLINRYDGLDMAARVTFTLALASNKAAILHTETTSAREREEQREGDRKVKVKEDWKEVGDLAADTYELVIDDLTDNVLKKQVALQTWAIGPNKDGKIEVKVLAGQTTEVRFTVHKYKKARFIGFSVKPGYAKAERCTTCRTRYPTGTGTCTKVGACFGNALKAKQCPQCKAYYDAGPADCAVCAVLSSFKGCECYCTTCSAYTAPKCSVGGHGALTAHYHCPTCAAFKTASCPFGHGALAANGFCATCNGFRPPVCPTNAGHGILNVGYHCATCGGYPAMHCASGHTTVSHAFKYECWKKGCGLVHPNGGWANWTMPCANGCKLTLNDEHLYLGLNDDVEDLLARCLVTKAAIQEAHTRAADVDEEVLKIFLGPEFYFRGKEGTYKTERLSIIMDVLREETKDVKYKDWLFVHGTAIGYLPQAPSLDTQYKLQIAADAAGSTVVKVTHGPNGKDDVNTTGKVPQENATIPPVAQWKVDVGFGQVVVQATKDIGGGQYEITLPGPVTVTKNDAVTLYEPSASEILNYALVQRGGPDNVAGLREDIVYKEKISPIDFLRLETNDWSIAAQRTILLNGQDTLALPTEGSDDLLSRKKNPISGEFQRSGIGGGSVFQMDGITFGLEVCLDHAKEKLKKYYASTPKGVGKVQIHLIPSWGMSITKTSLVGMVNTLVFNVDGPEGSDAAKVTGPGACSPLATPVSHLVPQPGPENVSYNDSSVQDKLSAQGKTVNNLDPDYKLLIPKHEHRVNRGAKGAEDYVWVDIYAAEVFAEAESV